jgi:ketosteroid isomerase-like protein
MSAGAKGSERMRKYLVPAVALALSACGDPGASGEAAESAVADGVGLAEFADQFDRAQLEKDRASLERMVADDLVFITSAGERQGKQEFIDGWTAAGDTFDPITLIDRVVRPLGTDAGVVSAETTLSGTSGGERFSSRFRFSDTFERIDGQWQAVHIQVTRIAE